jgi:hypothetical protein
LVSEDMLNIAIYSLEPMPHSYINVEQEPKPTKARHTPGILASKR